MMEKWIALTEQVNVFTILIVFGIFAQKIKLLSDENIDNLAAVVIKVVIPLRLITIIGSGNRGDVLQMGRFFWCAFLQYFICLGIAWASGRLFRIKEPTRSIHTAVAGIGNGSYIGYPLIFALFPEKASALITVYVVVDALVVWTLCPILANPLASHRHINFRRFVCHNVIAIVVGLTILLCNLQPQNKPWEIMQEIGATSRYFALFYVGADFSRKGMKILWKNPKVFSVVPVKLILCPLGVFLFFRFTGLLPEEYAMVLSVLSMVPSMTIMAILARNYSSDDEYASAAIMATTLIGILTMPCMTWLFTQLSA